MFFNNLIGIDIGSSTLKVAESTNHQSKVLKKIHSTPLPPGAVEHGVIRDHETVSKILQETLKQSNISTFMKRASISLNTNATLLKSIKVPKAQAENISEMIYYEADQHFEHDINDLYYDFFEFPVHEDEPDIPIVLVGSKKETVETHIQTVKTAGLKIGVVESEIFSIINMMRFNKYLTENLEVILNIGTHSSQLSFVKNGIFLYNRVLPLGGGYYTNQIANSFSISTVKSEEIKIASSQSKDLKDPGLHDLFSEINEQFCNEVQMNIDFFTNSDEAPMGDPVSKIYLCGGPSLTYKLCDALAENIQVPVVLMNPFKNFEIPSQLKNTINSSGTIFNVVSGLTLRKFEEVI